MLRVGIGRRNGRTSRNVIASAPTYHSSGSVGATTSQASVNVPVAANQLNDVLFVQAVCLNSNAPFTITSGWNLVTDVDVGAHRYAVWWKRSSGSETAPSVGNSGRSSTNLLSAQMHCYRGCRTSGIPYEGFAQASSASGPLNGVSVTSTGIKRLAVQLWARIGANSATAPTAIWTENLDQGTSGGGGCRYFADSAVLDWPATIQAGSRGTTSSYGMVGFALVGDGVDVAVAPKELKRGLWVWDFQSIVGTRASENVLLNESVASGVTDLYLFTPIAGYATRAAAMRSFVGRATALGIRCWGLDGDRNWFSDGDGPADLYASVDAMVAHNAGSSPDQKFVGLQIDMEPADSAGYTTFHNGVASSALSTTPGSGVWKDTQALDREYLMRDWCEIHAECRSRLRAAGALLGTALPTWFDDYFGEPITCAYGGSTKNVLEHLAALSDQIVFMNYNTNPVNQVSRISYEVSASAPAEVMSGIETVAGVGNNVSYGDTAGKQTKAAALADLQILRERYGNYPSFVGDALHDWSGWRSLAPESVDDSEP